MQNIVTLGEINDALKIAAVTAAQLADMGFAALANKPICEGLPPEESRRLRNAKLYPAESIGQIRVALAQRLAAPAATTTPDERKDLVPGVMRCAKCEFQLVRQVLAVNLGEVFAGDSKTEPCPNDCGPLWPVTWKQYAEQAMDAAESMADRAFAAEKEVKQLRGELSALDAPSLRAKVMSTPLGLHGTGIGDIGIAYRAGHRAALLTAADLVASSVVAAPAAVAVPAQALTGEARAEAINRLAPIRAKLASAAPAVAVPDESATFEKWWGSTLSLWGLDQKSLALEAWKARAALAATPADHVADAGKMVAAASRTTGYVAPKGRYVPPVLFSPYTGEPRDARDITSDPQGMLIVPPGALLTASSKTAAAPVLPEPVIVEWWSSENGLEDCDMAKRDDFIQVVRAIEAKQRTLLATATAPTEPFGYFKAEPFGWTDCGPDDEGAVALYEKPQAMLATGGQAQADARDARQFWAVIAPCGEGVFFSNEADARWTHTGHGSGSDGFGVPTIGEAFRESYEDEELELVRVHIAAIAAAKGEDQ